MATITDKQGVQRYVVDLMVNGDPHTVVVKGNTLLVNVLRDELDLTGTKKGCETGDCGSCTILLDGKPVDACLVLAAEADGCEITTIEGVAQHGELDRLQKSFLDQRRRAVRVLLARDDHVGKSSAHTEPPPQRARRCEKPSAGTFAGARDT